MRHARRLAVLALALPLVSCIGTRRLSDPTVEVRSPAGKELGVSTNYGLVFLGRSGRSGEVEITAWFGDGPSIEASVVEPLGGGLYTAETEIKLPRVPLSFQSPEPGQSLIVVGRNGESTWEESVRVARDSRVEGLLLEWKGRFIDAPEQVGAGLYVEDADSGRRRLVGLVTGTLELFDSAGQRQRYLTAVGPEELWRLVAYRREHQRRPRWVYRDDIL